MLYEYRCETGKVISRVMPASEHSGTITCACGKTARQIIRAPHVMPDIEPYKAVVTGQMIGSRSEHREYLKRHRLVEVGNDPIKPHKRKWDLPPLSEDIKRSIAEIQTHGVPEVDRERRG